MPKINVVEMKNMKISLFGEWQIEKFHHKSGKERGENIIKLNYY